MNIANITISETDYQILLSNGYLNDIKVISIKILPDDIDIKDNPVYKEAIKAYKKARNTMEDIRFNLTTNK